MTEGIAIAALAVVVYTYVLFPLIVIVRGWFYHRTWKLAPITPVVDLVIVCHNEAASIESKLANVQALDYPRDRLRIVVASDGSTDETDEIVKRLENDAVRLLSFPRRGKIPALNEAVATCRGEILVFSDANSHLQTDALRKLVRHFADSQIGCVAGNQVYLDEASVGGAAAGEKSYWSFDRWLKAAESRSGNTISATGAIYAIRRNLFQPVPPGVTDDFTVSTRVILQGYRLVFDADAVAYEPVAGKSQAEFSRKVRVMTRGLRGVYTVRALLNPLRHGFYAIQLLSHKVLRRLVAFPLLLLLFLTPWLWNAGGWLAGLAGAQIVFYGLALGGLAAAGLSRGNIRLLALPYYFCLVNVAAIVAATNFALGRKIEFWDSQRQDSQERPIRTLTKSVR